MAEAGRQELQAPGQNYQEAEAAAPRASPSCPSCVTGYVFWTRCALGHRLHASQSRIGLASCRSGRSSRSCRAFETGSSFGFWILILPASSPDGAIEIYFDLVSFPLCLCHLWLSHPLAFSLSRKHPCSHRLHVARRLLVPAGCATAAAGAPRLERRLQPAARPEPSRAQKPCTEPSSRQLRSCRQGRQLQAHCVWKACFERPAVAKTRAQAQQAWAEGPATCVEHWAVAKAQAPSQLGAVARVKTHSPLAWAKEHATCVQQLAAAEARERPQLA